MFELKAIYSRNHSLEQIEIMKFGTKAFSGKHILSARFQLFRVIPFVSLFFERLNGESRFLRRFLQILKKLCLFRYLL